MISESFIIIDFEKMQIISLISYQKIYSVISIKYYQYSLRIFMCSQNIFQIILP